MSKGTMCYIVEDQKVTAEIHSPMFSAKKKCMHISIHVLLIGLSLMLCISDPSFHLNIPHPHHAILAQPWRKHFALCPRCSWQMSTLTTLPVRCGLL